MGEGVLAVMGKGMVIKMKCPKCDGLMIYEKFFDMEESSRFFFYGWRCISCGNIVDKTIMVNRVNRNPVVERKKRRLKQAC